MENFDKLVLLSDQNPKNLDILLELARTASRLNKTDVEISSLKKILSIKNSPNLKSLLAQAIIKKADGQVTPKAKKLIKEALSEDPLNPGANYLNGLAQSQIGNEMLAFEIWTELYKRTSKNDTWKKDLEKNIRTAATNLGISKKALENKLKNNVSANNDLSKEIIDLNEKEQNIRIEASSGLTEEEINKMKDEAKANEETDKKEREKVDKLNTADGLIFQTEKQLKEFGEKLSEPNKKSIEDSLEKLKAIHKEQKIDEIDGAVEALNKSWEAASQEMYKATQEQQGQQGGPKSKSDTGNKSSSKNKKDDIADVDFEEVKEDKKEDKKEK